MSIRRLAIAAATLLVAASASPASADDGVWRVGDSWVIRFETLDLSQPAARQVLLAQVERTAEKACAGLRTRARRDACAADTIAAVLKAAEPGVRASLDVARFERDGILQAAR